MILVTISASSRGWREILQHLEPPRYRNYRFVLADRVVQDFLHPVWKVGLRPLELYSNTYKVPLTRDLKVGASQKRAKFKS